MLDINTRRCPAETEFHLISAKSSKPTITAIISTLVFFLMMPLGTQVRNPGGNSDIWGFLIAFGCALVSAKLCILFTSGPHIGALRSAMLMIAACADGVIVCILMSWRA